MTREELREKIRAAALHFTEEVSAIFGEAFAAVAAEFKSGPVETKAAPKELPAAPPARRPVGRPRLNKPAGTPAARPGRPPKAPGAAVDKRNRRSTDELDTLADGVLKLLSTNKTAMRVEEINRRLGTNTKQLMRPIQKLLSDGKIKKDGERRATVYFV